MKHVYEAKKKNPEGQERYLCSCGFVAQSEGSIILHIANRNNELKLKDAKPTAK